MYKTIQEMIEQLTKEGIEILEQKELMNNVEVLVYRKRSAICLYHHNHSIPYSEEVILHQEEVKLMCKYIIE